MRMVILLMVKCVGRL